MAESLRQISANLETINNTIREVYTARMKEAKENEERERGFQLRVVKIQTYSDSCHALLSGNFSLGLVFFGFIVIFYPFYLQATLEGHPFSTSGLLGLAGSFVIALIAGVFLSRSILNYKRNFKRISEMYVAVGKGEDLPPLEKMDVWKRISVK